MPDFDDADTLMTVIEKKLSVCAEFERTLSAIRGRPFDF